MIDPETLTGELVAEVRRRHKLSVRQLYELAGFEGKSNARLNNIEKKNSWKPGDRERVAAALERLERPASESRDVAASAPEPELRPATAAGYEPADITSNWWNDTALGAEIETLCDADDDPDDGEIAAWAEDVPETAVFALSGPPDDGDDETLADVLPASLSLSQAAERDDAILVTNGQLRTFDRCRRRWWLSWYRRLAPADEDHLGVRATGTRVHRALEAYYVPDGETPVDPRDALERVLVEDWTALARRAAERAVDEGALAELSDRFQQAASLERAMVEGYVQWLAETGADAGLRVVASEVTLTADLDVGGRLVRTAALLDTRVVRESDGVRLFLDHKTVGDLKSPLVILSIDRQMLHYHLVEWLATADGEARCDGALYNMLRRVKRTARANPPFYGRAEVRHNPPQLEAYRRHLIAETREILRVTAALDAGADHHDVAPPNPTPQCSWDCDFLPVCVMLDDGSRGEDALAALYVEVDPHARYDGDRKGAE